MRIEFETFNADVVTVLGLRTGDIIDRAEFEGATVGLTVAGKKTSSEMLQPEINNLAFWTWVGRIAFVVSAFIINAIYDPENAFWNWMTAGEVIFAVAVWCLQWSTIIITAVIGCAGTVCIGSGVMRFMEEDEKRWN
jgi:hypothetical protein